MMRKHPIKTRSAGSERGAAIVEASLTLMLFLIIVMGRAAATVPAPTPPPRRDWRAGGH